MFNNLFKKNKSIDTSRMMTIVQPDDKDRCIRAIEKWNEQKSKKDVRRLILTTPLYKKSDIFVGYGLLMFSNNGNFDMIDFWKIYEAV